jgi:hypothetical protein
MQNEPQKPDGVASPAPLGTIEVLPASAPPVLENPAEPKLPHGLSRRRIIVAFAIAGVSDAISAFTSFAPPLEWAVDLTTAVALFAVLGWRWLLLPGLIMEAIPGLSVLPFWVLVVSAVAVWGEIRPKLN